MLKMRLRPWLIRIKFISLSFLIASTDFEEVFFETYVIEPAESRGVLGFFVGSQLMLKNSDLLSKLIFQKLHQINQLELTKMLKIY